MVAEPSRILNVHWDARWRDEVHRSVLQWDSETDANHGPVQIPNHCHFRRHCSYFRRSQDPFFVSASAPAKGSFGSGPKLVLPSDSPPETNASRCFPKKRVKDLVPSRRTCICTYLIT